MVETSEYCVKPQNSVQTTIKCFEQSGNKCINSTRLFSVLLKPIDETPNLCLKNDSIAKKSNALKIITGLANDTFWNQRTGPQK